MRFPTQQARTTNERGLFASEEERLRRLEHQHALAALIVETWLSGTNACVDQCIADGKVRIVIGPWMDGPLPCGPPATSLRESSDVPGEADDKPQGAA